MPGVHGVVGPFSYTGRYIAARLRAAHVETRGFVRTSPPRRGDIDCRPLQFADPDRLASDLQDVSVLYNTYWIRFPHRGMTFDEAVTNTSILAQAAERAGVQRIVHLSVSNPSTTSPFAYFRGKAAAEDAILAAGAPTSIIRPTLVFGREDILLNNITWLLRRLRVFLVPNGGDYRVQPVFVEDVARLAVSEGQATGQRVLDAAGPEIITFARLLQLLASSARLRAWTPAAPLSVTFVAGRLLSYLVGDVVITPEELGALVAETLVSHGQPTATTALSTWLVEHGRALGQRYRSELKRHWTPR